MSLHDKGAQKEKLQKKKHASRELPLPRRSVVSSYVLQRLPSGFSLWICWGPISTRAGANQHQRFHVCRMSEGFIRKKYFASPFFFVKEKRLLSRGGKKGCKFSRCSCISKQNCRVRKFWTLTFWEFLNIAISCLNSLQELPGIHVCYDGRRFNGNHHFSDWKLTKNQKEKQFPTYFVFGGFLLEKNPGEKTTSHFEVKEFSFPSKDPTWSIFFRFTSRIRTPRQPWLPSSAGWFTECGDGPRMAIMTFGMANQVGYDAVFNI